MATDRLTRARARSEVVIGSQDQAGLGVVRQWGGSEIGAAGVC